MACEEAVGSEACHGGHGAGKSIGQGPNDGDMGEVGAEEFARDGKDGAGLDEVGRFQRRVVEEIRKRQAGYGIHKRRYRLLHSIAGEINPFEEVSDLVTTDAKSDLKHFWIRDFLTHGCVKTRAPLLNHSKVKSRCIGDGLKMVGRWPLRVRRHRFWEWR